MSIDEKVVVRSGVEAMTAQPSLILQFPFDTDLAVAGGGEGNDGDV